MTAKPAPPAFNVPSVTPPILSVAGSVGNLIQLGRSPQSEFAVKLRALARDVELGHITRLNVILTTADFGIIQHKFSRDQTEERT